MKARTWFLIFLMMLSVASYTYLAYFVPRIEFVRFFSTYSLIFIFYLLILYFLYKSEGRFDFKLVLVFAIVSRCLLIFSEPQLSDDYFRFFWDGELINEGVNPYAYLPEEYKQQHSLSEDQLDHYEGLNSKLYFSVYPPLNQFVFWSSVSAASILGVSPLIMLKLILLFFEMGTMLLLPKLLTKLSLPPVLAFVYLLNPLVILEVMGNVHFEGMTVFFLAISFLLLSMQKRRVSAIYFGMAISVKLIPLILGPLLLKLLRPKNAFVFFTLASLCFLTFFIPYIHPDLLQHFFSSVDLYFRRFEFNASIYYLVREIGYHIKGYNIIQLAGPILGAVVFIACISLAAFKKIDGIKDVALYGMICLTLYYFLSTTVHPWYLINLLFLSVLSGKLIIALSWTFLVALSYHAYQEPFEEQNLFILIEYVLLIGAMIWEFILYRKGKTVFELSNKMETEMESQKIK